MNELLSNSEENESFRDKRYIELSDEVNLHIEPSDNKVRYIFKKNGKLFADYVGEKPPSLTSRMTVGKEIIKHLVSSSELEKEVIDERFDEIKIEAQELLEKKNKELEKQGQEDPIENLKNSVMDCFSGRENIEYGRMRLGKLFGEGANIILSKNSHLTYQLDEKSKGYVELSFDDVKKIASEYVGEYLTNDKDIEIAVSHIDKRLLPEFNIVKFSNCLFDMVELKPLESEESVFTLIESDYNYNPKAKSQLIKEFLHSSLNRGSKEETEKEVQKVLEIIGYLFTSGNKRTILPIVVGIGGSGKSVLLNLIIKIFSVSKTADLKLQAMGNPHGTSSLLGKHLNVIRDSDDGIVENIGILKQMTGYDDLEVNPKFKHPILIDKDEIPKSILVANKIPRFKNLDSALLDRIVIIEFKHKFRGTKNENKNLLDDILDNDEEIEWLIYNSIEAYKNMVENGEEFLAKENSEKTELVLNKHTNPLDYLVSALVTDNSDEDRISEDKVSTNSFNKVCVKLAEKEGLDITSHISKGKIKSKPLLNAIKNVFSLWDCEYTTDVVNIDGKSKRYYPDIYKIKSKWKGLIEE